MTRPRACAFVLAALLCGSAPHVNLLAQIPPSSGPVASRHPTAVIFDHLGTNENRSYVVELQHEDAFVIQIERTCPLDFSYEVVGIVQARPAAGTSRSLKLGVSEFPVVETKTLGPVKHDSQYGGYLVTLRKTSEADSCYVPSDGAGVPVDTAKYERLRRTETSELQATPAALKDVTLVIGVKTIEWDLAFAGGFSVSNLVNRVFAIRLDDKGNRVLVRAPDKEDDASLGIAAFIQVFHHRRPKWATLVFGLGVRGDDNAVYYIGTGWRFGEKATMSAGLVLGPRNVLPPGLGIGSHVTDDNVLNDLRTRVVGKAFIAVSYAFLDVREKFQKPFAGGKKEP